MQKSLTFKRKANEVDAIQYKGEENADAVLAFLYKHGAYDPERFLRQEVWIGEWVVFDPHVSGYPKAYHTDSFIMRYEGI